MAVLADGIELFVHVLSPNSSSKPVCERSTVNAGIGLVYCLFAFCWLVVWTKHSDKDFSSVLTAASVVQLLGFLALTIKVRGTKSVAGISSSTLEMYALFFVTRLASTTIKSGYIPVDKSGRYVYQMVDFLCLLVVLQLLYCIHKTYKWTYQKDGDSMSIVPLIPPCVLLGFFVHADLNRSEVFDTIWAVSTNIDTVAMIPQLWMMQKIGGKVEGCTAHFTAALVASRTLSTIFWWTAYADLADDGLHLAAQMILVANGIQLLLAADFMYYYCSARFQGTSIQLPNQRPEEI